MYSGSCLCGAVTYELRAEPKAVANCHCVMCQKQHGAAFATYGSVLRQQMVYLSGEAEVKVYRSSPTVERRFCGVCGSNLTWSCNTRFPEWIAVAIGTLDTPFAPRKCRDLYQETRIVWLEKN